MNEPPVTANLLTSLHQMEIALDVIEEALVWTDSRGTIERCNAAARSLFKLPFDGLCDGLDDSLIGRSLVDLLPLQQWGQPLLAQQHPVNRGLSASPVNQTQRESVDLGCYEFGQQEQSRWIRLTVVSVPTLATASAVSGKLFVIRPVTLQTSEPLFGQAESHPNLVSGLQHSTELYQQALDGTQIGIWDWDLQTNTASLSPKAAELLGLDPCRTQISYATWRQTIHPKDVDRIEQSIAQAMVAQGNYEVEYRVIYPDSSLHWLLARGRGDYSQATHSQATHSQATHSSDAEQPQRLVGVIMDISERKRNEVVLRLAEEAWQENQQILGTIMANLPGGVFRCLYLPNESVVFAYASAAYQELLKLSPQEMGAQPQSVFERMHPDDRSRWQDVVQTAQNTLEPSYLEYRVILPDGQEKWLARTAQFSWALNGDFVVDGIDIDITDRKQAEAALATSQQFIQKVVEATPGILYVYDLIEQSNIYVNREVEALLGYTPSEIETMGANFIAERLHPEDRARAQTHFNQFETLADGVKVGWEYRLQHVDGSSRWLYSQDTIFARTLTGQPRLILGSILDITERKKMESALKSILQGTASATGEAFFPVLVQNMAEALDVRHAFVSELVGDCLYTLACCSDRQIQPSQRFELASHPCCRTSIEEGFVCYPKQTQQHFPDNFTLKTLQAESYLGVAMLDGAGNPIGNLCIVDDQPLKNIEWAEAILRIFAARAAAELERQRATNALQQLNQELEARVEQRTQELIASLDEKEVLLKEVHHRVKNNLQMIQSLLNLQVRFVEEPKALDVLSESQRRIKAMALVHEKLYQSDSLARINFAEYVRSLTRDLLQSYTPNAATIRLLLEVAELELPVDTAIPCGLIINELFSNAMKYAFSANQSGVITVQFQADQGEASACQIGCQGDQVQHCHHYRLTVADNGVGIPAEVDVSTTKSLGLRLVHALTRQLRGTLQLERHTGTAFTITFAKSG